jgi:inner membrane protein
MASVLSHPAVPLAIAAAAGRAAVPRRLAYVACVASVVPDLDALGYWAGVPYGSPLGHRGFTHSIVFALLMAGAAAAFTGRLGATRGIAFGTVLLSGVSHGLLDGLTTGGMGVAYFSPFSNVRSFLPWHVIQVSPIGVVRFVSERGLRILRSELLWIWLPCAVLAAAGVGLRRFFREQR